MTIILTLPETLLDTEALRAFLLFRDCVRPAIEARRAVLEAMYAPRLGRPEIDPALLLGITVLQALECVPDRQAVDRCLFDARWRLALGLPADWPGFHPTGLVHFRARLLKHDQAKLALDAGLSAMRQHGYLPDRRALRIDSTHVLAHLAAMSRLECVRETLRLALAFLAAWGGPEAWEPWFTRYAVRNAPDERQASAQRLHTTMAQAGADMRDVLARVARMSKDIAEAEPAQLLRRVFAEQFELCDGQPPRKKPRTSAGAVHNPHDPQAQWSTKRSLGKAGWVGYKTQVCETAPETPRAPGEPTAAVITALVTQPAITSDHGSVQQVLDEQAANAAPAPAPETVFIDAGYTSGPALNLAEQQGYELCGPIGAPPHSAHRFGSDAFAVDLPNRQATCPAGQTSAQCSRITEAGREVPYYYFVWSAADCAACPLASKCLSRKKRAGFRTLQVGSTHMQVQARRRLCRRDDYKARMQRRNGIEGTISELKRGYGARRCRYRGRPKTDLQMQMAGAACNLRRWAARSLWLERQRSKPATKP